MWGEQCLVSARDILSVGEQRLVSVEEILSVGEQLLVSAERRVDNYLVEIRRKTEKREN